MKNRVRMIGMTAVLLIGIAVGLPGLRSRRVAAQSVVLTGSYGFTLTQTWDGGDPPLALIGVIKFDGAGNYTGSGTLVGVRDPKVATVQLEAAQFAGTYTVNADGTGTAKGGDGTATAFVITDGGSGLVLVSTAGFGTRLLTGTARKQ